MNFCMYSAPCFQNGTEQGTDERWQTAGSPQSPESPREATEAAPRRKSAGSENPRSARRSPPAESAR